jgi:ADP-glucose pyrophosphorylase
MAASRAVLGDEVRTAAETVAIASPGGIGENVQIRGLTSIGAGVSIGQNSTVTDCIILDNVKIGANVALSHCIVDENCTIEDSVVMEGQAKGSALVIAAGSVLRRGSKMQFM